MKASHPAGGTQIHVLKDFAGFETESIDCTWKHPSGKAVNQVSDSSHTYSRSVQSEIHCVASQAESTTN